jgi:TrmH RNA methyltransferase
MSRINELDDRLAMGGSFMARTPKKETEDKASWYGLKSGLEMRLYGFHSCFSVFKSRPGDIVRVYVTERKLKAAAAILKYCAEHKRAYHIVTEEDLANIVSSVHHEGMAMVVKRRKTLTDFDFLKAIQNQPAQSIIYLDGVSNPHNLGAIMRTLAHFGLKWIIGGKESLPELSPSAARTSEGASELVQLVSLNQPIAILKELKSLGWEIIGTSSHHQKSYKSWIPKKKTVLILGSETSGISDEIHKLCDLNVSIDGTGAVESLNVSVAMGIFAAQLSQGNF